ncbi:MAG TPA: hypothetical protein GX511_00065, partial [Firmicutes bacterium]|nr:hypothetical protein [Bacillota bacterium]
SAHLAAETLLELKAHNRPFTAANLSRYEVVCQAAFGRDLAWALALNHLARRFPDLWQRAFFASPAWFAEALQIARGRRNYRDLARWSLKRLPHLVPQALRLAGMSGLDRE